MPQILCVSTRSIRSLFERPSFLQLRQLGGDFRILLGLQLIAFDHLDRVKDRIAHLLLPIEGERLYVQIVQRTALDYGAALPGSMSGRIGALHERVNAAALEGADLGHGNAQSVLQGQNVDLIAVLFDRVHHVERQHDRDIQLQQLCGQVQVALQIGCIYDVDDAVGLLVQQKPAGDDLLRRVGRERIDAGQIDDLDALGELLIGSDLFVDRDARPVAHVGSAAGQRVEQRGLS